MSLETLIAILIVCTICFFWIASCFVSGDISKIEEEQEKNDKR